MKKCSTLLLLAIPFFLSAQNMGFGELIEYPCQDGSTVMQPDNWRIYQTLDNTWDGPVDSTWCVNVESGSWGYLEIEEGTFDETRPLFAHAQELEDGVGLIPNELYNFRWHPNGDADLENTDFCNDGFCTGVRAGISVPNPNDPDNPAMRWYQANFSPNDYYWGDVAVACAPSEYMSGQQVTDIIYKGIFPTGMASFNVPNCDIYYWANFIYEGSQSNWYYNGAYNFEEYNSNFVIAYDEADGFPSSEEPSFMDMAPIPNEEEPQMVDINIGQYDHLIFQPFTYFRGGLVEGSDSTRHNISLNNYGSSSCVQGWIGDFWLDDGNRYHHLGGDLRFGPEGCLMFRPGGILEIRAGETLHYGPDGTGMLGLTEDCVIRINPGSELRVNNLISLWDVPWIHDRQEIEIPLTQGAHLAFGPNARIIDNCAEPLTIRLLMQGGSVDFGDLTPEERSYFELVWENDEVGELLIAPNPSAGVFGFDWVAAQSELLQVEVYTTGGKLVHAETHQAHIGVNRMNIDPELSDGSYVIKIFGSDRRETGRVMIR